MSERWTSSSVVDPGLCEGEGHILVNTKLISISASLTPYCPSFLLAVGGIVMSWKIRDVNDNYYNTHAQKNKFLAFCLWVITEFGDMSLAT